VGQNVAADVSLADSCTGIVEIGRFSIMSLWPRFRKAGGFLSVPSVRSCLILISMHPLFSKASGFTETIIAAAIEVHRDKGPGLIESIYEWCLITELGLQGLACVSQKCVLIQYKGFTREEPLRCDVLIEGCVLVEAKAVEKVLPIHKAKLLSYMKLLDVPLGLLINFHEMRVTDGVSRLILPGANQTA
jgi:GxxExxY protein